MEKEDLVGLVKDISLGINSSIFYPAEHHMIRDRIKKIIDRLHFLSSELSDISLVFFGEIIIIEGFNIDTTESPILRNFVKRYKKLGIESITIEIDCLDSDIAGLIDVAVNPPSDLTMYEEDINTLLIEKKIEKIYFNTVEFKIKPKDEEGFGKEEGAGGLGGMGGVGVVPGATGLGSLGLGLSEEGKFDIETFLEKGCGITGGESPKEVSDKVTNGLIRLYDHIVSSSAEEGLKDHIPVFNEIINSLTPEIKMDIMTNKIKLKKISSIIKSIIMTFSDEEIVEMFLSKTRLLGVHEAKDMLEDLTPSRLDRILPDIKEALSTMDIQEEYLKELEEALWHKGGDGTGGFGEGTGGLGEGEGQEFIKNFTETNDSEYGKKEIANFFRSFCGLKKGDGAQVAKISNGFERFVGEFIKQYGEDELLRHTLKIKKTFESAPFDLRDKIFQRIFSKGEHLQITIAKIAIPLTKDETIVDGIIKLISEDKRQNLLGFLSSLEEERIPSVKGLLEKRLKELDWKEEDIDELWDELTTTSSVGVGIGTGGTGGPGVSKRAYQRLSKRIKTGMDLSEISTLIKSLYDSLNSEHKEARINSLTTIKSVMNQLFESEKITIVKRMIEELKDYSSDEDDIDVYAKYIELVSEAGLKAEEMGFDFIVKDIISFFAEEVGDLTKAKVIIPYLSKFENDEARNVFLSLLWIDELRDVVIDGIEGLGARSIPYLMELLKDTEDKKVRLALLNAIQSLGPKAVGVVSEYLKDERWYVRRNAVRILGVIGDKDIVNNLFKLKNDDERVQFEIIRSIKHLLKEEAESYILKFLPSEFPEVEKYAIMSLKNIVSGNSLPILNRRLVKESFPPNEEVEIKKAICSILEDEGGKSSLEPLGEILTDTKIFGIPKYSEDLRFNALRAVAKIGGPKAKKIIKTLQKDHSKKIRDFAVRFVT